MSALDSVKQFVEQRLSAAVDDIFDYITKTVINYEEELERLRKLLDIMLQPEIRLRRGDVPLLTATAKISAEQQEFRTSLDQKDPVPTCIKQEQEEVWMVEEEQVPSSPPMSVKSEEYPDKHQSSQFHQSKPEENTLVDLPTKDPTDEKKTAADGENCGESKPHSYVLSPRDDNSSDFLESGNKDKDDLRRYNGSKKYKTLLVMRKTREKPYCKLLQQSSDLKPHLRVHTAEKPFRCSDCDECFSHREDLQQHMMCHTGEKPFSGGICDGRLTPKSQITTHECVDPSSSSSSRM